MTGRATALQHRARTTLVADAPADYPILHVVEPRAGGAGLVHAGRGWLIVRALTPEGQTIGNGIFALRTDARGDVTVNRTQRLCRGITPYTGPASPPAGAGFQWQEFTSGDRTVHVAVARRYKSIFVPE